MSGLTSKSHQTDDDRETNTSNEANGELGSPQLVRIFDGVGCSYTIKNPYMNTTIGELEGCSGAIAA